MKKGLKILFKVCLAALLLFLFFREIDFGALWSVMEIMPISAIGYGVAVNILVYFISAYKWSLFLPEYPFSKLIMTAAAGRFYSFILPGQISGEAAKVYQLSRFKKEAGLVASSVLVDKLTGLMSLAIISIIGAIFSSRALPVALIIFMFLFFLAFISLLMLVRNNFFYGLLTGLFARMSKKNIWMGKFAEQTEKMISHWLVFSKNLGLIFYSILVGCILQSMGVLLVFILSRGLMIDASLFDYCWIYGFVAMALLIPLTVGGLGIREGSFIGLLGWLGVSGEKALALSLVFLGFQIFDAVMGGSVELFKFYMKPKINLS